MLTNFTPVFSPSPRTASVPLAMATLLLLGASCAAQAAEETFSYSLTPSRSDATCGFSVLCTSRNTTAAAGTMQLAQQDEVNVDASANGDMPANAEPSPAPAGKSNVSYPAMLWDDTKHVLSAPARWDDQEWKNMGLYAVGIVGVMAVIDRPVQDAMRRIAPDNDRLTPNNNRFLKEMERFGREYSLGVLGGFYLAGALGDNENATAVAQDGLTAVIIASGIITTVTKVAVGRARPREDVGVAHFRPFGGDQSFPSGHTADAFAVASVIANHYDETWITCTSYSVASLVGVARSYHGGHFVSDIVAGAMIGTMVGKSVVEHNKSMRSSNIVMLPEIAPGMVGVRFAGSF